MMLAPRHGTVLLSALLAAGCGNGAGRDVPETPAAEVSDSAGDGLDGDTIPEVRIPDLLESRAWNGRQVRVRGRCLGYQVPPLAVGGPPRTRSDWQLEDQGVAIHVTGPLPDGCSATEGSTHAITLVARVLEDSLPGLGDGMPRVRRYLEWHGGLVVPVRP